MGARGDLGRRGAGAVRGRRRAVQGRARRHRRGRDLALHPGRLHRPLPRPAPADLGADQGLQAHLARGCLLARRREERAADADLRHGVLQPEGSRRPPRAARAGDARATTAGSARSSTCSISTSTRPGRRSGIRRGWRSTTSSRICAGGENASRGYSEVKTPLIYDKALWETSGHWEKFRENMFLIPIDDEQTFGIKPMNCPGHMLLFGSQLRSYRDLPLRYAEAAPLHRNELAGALHGLTRVRYVTQDDAHIFCTEEQVAAEIDGVSRVRPLPLRSLRDRAAGRALDPARQQARDGRRVGLHGGQARRGARAARDRVLRRRRGGRVLRAEDRPPHRRRPRTRSWQIGTIQLDAQMPARFGLTYMGADNHEHPVFVVHRALFGSLERFIGILIEHYGGAFPLWLAPVQVRRAPGERAAPRRSRRRSPDEDPRGRATASRSTSATRRSASGSATASSRRSPSSSYSASASPRRRSRSGPAAKARRRARSRSCSPISGRVDRHA